MRLAILWLIGILAALPAAAERPGEFDYYVLALSWSPNWCAVEGDARESDQCHPRHDYGWTLHGLWPQYERGWPDYCQTSKRAPSRSMTAEMADIMGNAGLAWHQWKKHGTCTGLTARDYFALSRHAYESVTRPEVFRKINRPVRLPASVVEEAFLKANPGWTDRMMTVTCRDGHIAELRLCLDRDLTPRLCGADVARDCTRSDALLTPVR